METTLAVQKLLNVLLSVAILAICLAILGKHGFIEKIFVDLCNLMNKNILLKILTINISVWFSEEKVHDVAETNQVRCIEKS